MENCKEQVLSIFEARAELDLQKATQTQVAKRMHFYHSMLGDYARFVKNTEIAKIVIEDGGVVMTTKDNILIHCDFESFGIIPFDNINFGGYETEETNLVLSIIDPDCGSVFDIGANCGWYSLSIAKRFPNAKIYAFEPMERTRQNFEKNIKLNGFNNISVFPNGFWNENTTLSFNYNRDMPGATSIKNILERDSAEKIDVEVQTLDSFVSNNNVSKVDFIKCDVEGAEYMVLRGGGYMLNEFKPKLFLEMLRKWSAKFNYHPNDIIQYLKPFGYSCYEIIDGKLRLVAEIDAHTVSTNFVFLNKENHSSVINRLCKI